MTFDKKPKYAPIFLSSDKDRFGFVFKLDVEVEFTKLLGCSKDLLWFATVILGFDLLFHRVLLLVIAEDPVDLDQLDPLLGLPFFLLLLRTPGAGLFLLTILG